jgi:hypothetical protein
VAAIRNATRGPPGLLHGSLTTVLVFGQPIVWSRQCRPVNLSNAPERLVRQKLEKGTEPAKFTLRMMAVHHESA